MIHRDPSRFLLQLWGIEFKLSQMFVMFEKLGIAFEIAIFEMARTQPRPFIRLSVPPGENVKIK